MKEKKQSKLVNAVINEYISQKDKNLDPNGSWTGRPENPFEKPVQDADDL